MRRPLLLVLLLLGALGAVALGVAALLSRDRQALTEQFGRERQAQLVEATREVADSLDDLGDDLRFAADLVSQPGTLEEHRRELRALLEAVGQYRAVAVFGPDGRERLRLVDRRAEHLPLSPLQGPAWDETVRQALDGPAERIVTSRGIADASSRGLRVFATALPREAPGGGGAVALLVDTEPLFAPLRLVSADPDTRLLLLGFYGQPAPASSPEVAAWYQRLGGPQGAEVPGLAALAARMRAGQAGTLSLTDAEAERLGLGRADAVAAFTPIRMRNEPFWSVATLSSTRVLRAHERTLLLRLSLAALLVVGFLGAFGAYVVLASRRAVALEESRRHAERLAHLHEKTQKILDHIPTGVLALRDDGRVSAVNQALRSRLPQDVLGGTLEEALPAAPAPVVRRLEELVAAARAEGQTRSLLGVPLALFEEEGHYNVHAVPLVRGEDEVRALLVLEDLSGVRMLEDQLLRAEKLATVGVLAAGVAHEIGTPLGIIRGRAEYMLGKAAGNASQGRGLSAIIEQIDRVSRTLRQLLDFSRLQPERVDAVALAPVLAGIQELLDVEAERRKVRLDVDVPARLPPLAANADQLQQVLLNLALNACDACGPGGRVRVSARGDGLAEGGAWGLVELTVEDDGCGIAPEHLHQVFDPFFTTKKRGQGTGLGLTMVAQITRNHGGRVELDSAPGRGTTVRLLWPAAGPRTEEEHDAV